MRGQSSKFGIEHIDSKMNIALCQINPTVGDFYGNRDKIISYYRKAVDRGGKLIVFPELVISGYPPQDLLWESGFVERNLEVLDEIAQQTTIPAIIGYVRKNEENLLNSAAVCMDGKVVYYCDKILLPTYDIFDEYRYFSPGESPGVFDIKMDGKDRRIGIQICEDLWDHDYECKVTDLQKKKGAQIIINISY